MAKIKPNWDGPLTPLKFKMNLPELMSAIQAEMDRSFLGKGHGDLRREAGKLSNYRFGKDFVEITLPLPYARIQEEGGWIPDRRPKVAQAMHFFDKGNEVFTKFASGFHILPNEYLKGGVHRWLGNRKGVKVEWPD